MSPEDEMVMLSALQHFLFCKRQYALIHEEGLWRENYLTTSGKLLHERVDSPCAETRRDLHIATSLRLVSHRLGIMGVADLVEFHKVDSDVFDGQKIAAKLPDRSGWWRPFPVEYKRGQPKSHRADEVQLCAQALCLEEMLGVEISDGALFYGTTRRRCDVTFDDGLRNLTELVIKEARAVRLSGETPPAIPGKWCAACSLVEVCQPQFCDGSISARKWLARQMEGV